MKTPREKKAHVTDLIKQHTTFPVFTFQPQYFPLRLCFYLTINKAKGQTLQFVGLDLRTPVFSHGMLYVALSNLWHAPFFPWRLHIYIYFFTINSYSFLFKILAPLLVKLGNIFFQGPSFLAIPTNTILNLLFFSSVTMINLALIYTEFDMNFLSPDPVSLIQYKLLFGEVTL